MKSTDIIIILSIISMVFFALGCLQPNFEAQDYSCQQFINNGSHTTFVKIKNYNGYIYTEQDGYAGIVKEATSHTKEGFFSNDIRTKIVFVDGVTITSRKNIVYSESGWGENKTYLVTIPLLNMYELDCNK